MSLVGRGREQLLSRAFVDLADTLVDDYDVIDPLVRLVDYGAELLGADAGGILLADSQGTLRVVACSHEDAEVMELPRPRSDQGPCVDCFRGGAAVSIPDLADAVGRCSRPPSPSGEPIARCTRCRCGCEPRRSRR